jgi:hypothetical protein
MAMWAMMAAPLYMSTDLRTLRQWQKDILMNQEVIAVDQVFLSFSFSGTLSITLFVIEFEYQVQVFCTPSLQIQ